MNDELNEIFEGWLEKSYNDRKIVEILLREQDSPLDGICFHCQQYVEKLLKALLTKKGIVFRKTHDIRELAGQIVQFAPSLEPLMEDADILSIHGVDTRYPQRVRFITKQQTDTVVKLAFEFGRVLEEAIRDVNDDG